MYVETHYAHIIIIILSVWDAGFWQDSTCWFAEIHCFNRTRAPADWSRYNLTFVPSPRFLYSEYAQDWAFILLIYCRTWFSAWSWSKAGDWQALPRRIGRFSISPDRVPLTTISVQTCTPRWQHIPNCIILILNNMYCIIHILAPFYQFSIIKYNFIHNHLSSNLRPKIAAH